MIIHDGKKTMSMILDGRGNASPDPDNSGGDLDEHLTIAHDMLKAFRSNSAESLAKTLKAFAECCARDDQMEDEGR